MKKKVLAVILGAAMVVSMAGCGGSNAKTTDTAESTETTDSTDDAESTDATEATDGESYTIGISQFAEHGSLDNCREGFLEGLKEEGIEEGKNLTVKVNNADADMGTASQIAQSFVTDNVDLICAIATPSAQAAYNAANGKRNSGCIHRSYQPGRGRAGNRRQDAGRRCYRNQRSASGRSTVKDDP